jgi:hypothetical protein
MLGHVAPPDDPKNCHLENAMGLVLHLLVACARVRRMSREAVKCCSISVPVDFSWLTFY